MTVKICETRNYDLFETFSVNRQIGETLALKASMKKYGWIDAYPMHVVKSNNGKLLIKAGHHRFFVAQSLGMAVKYVVCEDEATIPELERASQKWNTNDYLCAYVRQENPHYLAIKRFRDKNQIPITACIALMAGRCQWTGQDVVIFKTGAFTVKDEIGPRIIADLVQVCRQRGLEFASSSDFVLALARIIKVKQVNVKLLRQKLASQNSIVSKCGSIGEYLRMFEKLYNKNLEQKIPLAFFAKEAARKKD
jgi:hypothetical protein